jgi:drug/metabolite transporter (DMT)-like permease
MGGENLWGSGLHPRSPAAIRQPLRVYELAAAMAVVSTMLPVFMLSVAIRVIGPDRSSLIGSVGPISTIFLAWAFLGEPASLLQIGGRPWCWP